MTVFTYLRVSTAQQAAEGNSLEAQTNQVLFYAISRGLKLAPEGVFVEKGGQVGWSSKPALAGQGS